MLDIDNPTWIRAVTQAEAASAASTINEIFFALVALSPQDMVRFRRAALMLLLLERTDVIRDAVAEMHAGVREEKWYSERPPRFRPEDLEKACSIARSLLKCLEEMGGTSYDEALKPPLEALGILRTANDAMAASASDNTGKNAVSITRL
ncbi:hypothetical protein AB4Y42_21920 [Paraburkholderia sp. EG286B]|uniref:hypothetical protein n=1 Tax=Paraburkholderia sp. EG286B TaxID=3237011 RepID=UPI0034D1AD6B